MSRMTPAQALAAAQQHKTAAVPEPSPDQAILKAVLEARKLEAERVAIACHEIVANAPTKLQAMQEILFRFCRVPRPLDLTSEGAD